VDPRLAFAVLDSLRRWKFRPAQLDGEPTEVRYQLEVDFLIRR